MRKKLLVLIFFVMITPAYAQESYCGTADSPCTDWRRFDYYNPEADISKVPPSELDISKVVASSRVKEMTDEQLRQNMHEVMSSGGGSQLTSVQIQNNVDYIDDLTLLDKQNVREALHNKFGVYTQLESKSFVKNGILKAANGEANLNEEIYKRGFIFVDNDGKILFLELDETMKKIDIPATDIV